MDISHKSILHFFKRIVICFSIVTCIAVVFVNKSIDVASTPHQTQHSTRAPYHNVSLQSGIGNSLQTKWLPQNGLNITLFNKELCSNTQLTQKLRNARIGTDLKTNSNVFLNVFPKSLKISARSTITNYDSWQLMHLQPDSIEYVPGFKNPCFFVENSHGSCEGNYYGCTQATLHCLPYFLLVGFAKTGTTDLCYRLNKHQQIIQNIGTKELEWWSNRFTKTDNTLDKYTYHYSNMAKLILQNSLKSMKNSCMNEESNSNGKFLSNVIAGDFTPATVTHSAQLSRDDFNRESNGTITRRYIIPHRVYHVNPNAKIIISMREPVARVLSQYNHYNSIEQLAGTQEEFHETVVTGIQWWKGCIAMHSEEVCAYNDPEAPLQYKGKRCHLSWIVKQSIYVAYVKKWFEVFPRNQIQLVKFEDYAKEPLTYISKHLLPFLGTTPFNNATLQVMEKLEKHNIVRNVSKRKIKMPEKTKRILEEFYKPYNAKLKSLLGEHFSWP